uniref:Anoctamin n=1 Tax=Poecilia mexicana TaxID=48701 RepID=A0A3B3XLT2_9TELE
GARDPCYHGLFFQDGQRRVDYILTYPVRKSGGGRSSRQSDHSLTENFASRTVGQSKQVQGASTVADVEMGCLGETLNSQEDHKTFRREEFEKNLKEMGLELEKDEEAMIPGLGFVKIHAPWNVLCREAELMKLKMPTRKVSSKISSMVNKVLEPLHPNVEEHHSKNIKHLSHSFSREKQHLGYFFTDNIKTMNHNGEDSDKFVTNTMREKPGKYFTITQLILVISQQLLYEEWANYSVFYKYQPIGLVRKYFGEKIGLYFAWLGLYTQMLIPASLVGVIVFLYGCATVDDNIPSMEICDPKNNITMCPLCDRVCSYWKLSTACGTARASHLFDNPATVFFSIFMALWAAMFMEHWKRRQMRLNYEWDLTGFEDEEDHPRAEYEFRVMQKSLKKEKKSPQKVR